MAQTTYQVTLSRKGAHSVTTVAGDDPEAVKAAFALGERYLRACKDWINPRRMKAKEEEREAPICAVHNVPMVWQKGRKGFFWSCHQRNADGSFCTCRPEEG